VSPFKRFKRFIDRVKIKCYTVIKDDQEVSQARDLAPETDSIIRNGKYKSLNP